MVSRYIQLDLYGYLSAYIRYVLLHIIHFLATQSQATHVYACANLSGVRKRLHNMSAIGDSVEVELRVGMLDFALAKLMSSEYHTIEFPTILLPDNVVAGSIIKLQCSRAAEAEVVDKEQFENVQNKIKDLFASDLPKAPVLRVRNTTQTSTVIEWDPIDVAAADLHFMALYKGDQRVGFIPQPLKRTATKVSNLEIDAPYKFRLMLSTSAGLFESNELEVRTHKMTNLTGIVVCIGSLEHSNITESDIRETLSRIGCKEPQTSVKLDTTHFVCSTEGGVAYEKAVELNIPIVRPEWLKACESERRLASVRGFYLSVDPPSVPKVNEAKQSEPEQPKPEESKPEQSQPEESQTETEQPVSGAKDESQQVSAEEPTVQGRPGSILSVGDNYHQNEGDISTELDRVGPIDPSSVKSVKSVDISSEKTDDPAEEAAPASEEADYVLDTELQREVTADPNAELRCGEEQKVIVNEQSAPEPQSADVLDSKEKTQETAGAAGQNGDDELPENTASRAPESQPSDVQSEEPQEQTTAPSAESQSEEVHSEEGHSGKVQSGEVQSGESQSEVPETAHSESNVGKEEKAKESEDEEPPKEDTQLETPEPETAGGNTKSPSSSDNKGKKNKSKNKKNKRK